ncbi:MAG: hypothetical protein QF412_05525 [Planctomycetota bacterium]|jgi:hypothetical protein|nr:hypothetical protein [Planctomycetota bacterium]
MTVIPIVCENCGARYRLPETFKSDSAKCKKCGAMIDVAAQRTAFEAGGEPAADSAAKPEEAKPERPSRRGKTRTSSRSSSRSRRSKADQEDESEPRRKSRGSSRGERAASRSSRRGQRGDEEDAEETGRPGRRSARKKESKALMIGSAIGILVVVVAVIIIVMTSGGDEPAKESTAKANSAPQAKDDNTEKADDSGANDGGTEDENAQEPVKAAEEEVAEEKKPAKPKVKKEVTSKEDVFNPSESLDAIEWPDMYDAAHQAHVNELLAAIKDGGFAGTKAKRELETMGHGALVGIINTLRDINYLDSEETMFGYELNRLIESMVGLNTRYRPGEIGSEVVIEDAHWNARTVKAWQTLWDKVRDPEKYKKYIESKGK